MKYSFLSIMYEPEHKAKKIEYLIHSLKLAASFNPMSQSDLHLIQLAKAIYVPSHNLFINSKMIEDGHYVTPISNPEKIIDIQPSIFERLKKQDVMFVINPEKLNSGYDIFIGDRSQIEYKKLMERLSDYDYVKSKIKVNQEFIDWAIATNKSQNPEESIEDLLKFIPRLD